LSYADQWERCSSAGTGCAAIPGATGTVYRATAADVGHELELAVTATGQFGLTATAVSDPTGVVADPAAPVATVAPAFTGIAQKGQVLTITGRGKWTSPDQLSFAEQWERCDGTGSNCVAIGGATGFVYRASAADEGHEITVAVTATDLEGQQATAAATPSAVVPTPAPVDVTAPQVTGTATDGLVLTRAATGTWSSPLPLSFAGQWERCDDTGANCEAIAGATAYVYRLKAADVGHEVTLAITATDTLGQQSTATAVPTAVVGDPAAPVNTSVPAFTGAATQGQVLTITGRGRWTSPDTLSYGEQWERCDDTGADCTAIAGATGFVYRLTTADVGSEVTVTVTATDAEGQTGQGTAAPTAPVTST
jgi:predicted RNA-binding protein with TRAM domain